MSGEERFTESLANPNASIFWKIIQRTLPLKERTLEGVGIGRCHIQNSTEYSYRPTACHEHCAETFNDLIHHIHTIFRLGVVFSLFLGVWYSEIFF
jgi:hypothetical protein